MSRSKGEDELAVLLTRLHGRSSCFDKDCNKASILPSPMATLIVSGLGLVGRRALLCLRAFLNGASIESSLYLLLSLMGVRNTTRLGLEIL